MKIKIVILGSKTSSRQDGIYQGLKKKIVSLDYAPGQSLIIQDIAKQFHVSTTPIREVVIRLEGERLVRRFPNKKRTRHGS